MSFPSTMCGHVWYESVSVRKDITCTVCFCVYQDTHASLWFVSACPCIILISVTELETNNPEDMPVCVHECVGKYVLLHFVHIVSTDAKANTLMLTLLLQ